MKHITPPKHIQDILENYGQVVTPPFVAVPHHYGMKVMMDNALRGWSDEQFNKTLFLSVTCSNSVEKKEIKLTNIKNGLHSSQTFKIDQLWKYILEQASAPEEITNINFQRSRGLFYPGDWLIHPTKEMVTLLSERVRLPKGWWFIWDEIIGLRVVAQNESGNEITEICPGAQVNIIDNSNLSNPNDPGCQDVSYQWTIGGATYVDNTSSTSQNPSVIFNDPGIYEIHLNLSNGICTPVKFNVTDF